MTRSSGRLSAAGSRASCSRSGSSRSSCCPADPRSGARPSSGPSSPSASVGTGRRFRGRDREPPAPRPGDPAPRLLGGARPRRDGVRADGPRVLDCRMRRGETEGYLLVDRARSCVAAWRAGGSPGWTRRSDRGPGRDDDDRRSVDRSRRDRQPRRLRAAGPGSDGPGAPSTTSPAGPGTSSRSARPRRRGAGAASGRGSSSTSATSTRDDDGRLSRSRCPVGIAPMAAHGLAHPDAELATARARGRGRDPVHALDDVEPPRSRTSRPPRRTASAGSSSTPRPIRAAAGGSSSARRRPATGAILVTVDLPVLGYRERDLAIRLQPAVPHGNFADDAGPDHAVARRDAGRRLRHHREPTSTRA